MHKRTTGTRYRAERKQLERFQGLLPEIQGQNLAVTVLHMCHVRSTRLEAIWHVKRFQGGLALRLIDFCITEL